MQVFYGFAAKQLPAGISPKGLASQAGTDNLQTKVFSGGRSQVPTAIPDLTAMLIALIPVIVGGVIGLLGGLIGPPMAYWLGQRAERKKRKIEKFEEMLDAIYSFEHWIGLQQNSRVFGAQEVVTASPLAKARAISAIYFPDLDHDLEALEGIARQYEIWMLEAAKRRLSGNTGNLTEGLEDAYRPYMEALSALLRGLSEYAGMNKLN